MQDDLNRWSESDGFRDAGMPDSYSGTNNPAGMPDSYGGMNTPAGMSDGYGGMNNPAGMPGTPAAQNAHAGNSGSESAWSRHVNGMNSGQSDAYGSQSGSESAWSRHRDSMNGVRSSQDDSGSAWSRHLSSIEERDRMKEQDKKNRARNSWAKRTEGSWSSLTNGMSLTSSAVTDSMMLGIASRSGDGLGSAHAMGAGMAGIIDSQVDFKEMAEAQVIPLCKDFGQKYQRIGAIVCVILVFFGMLFSNLWANSISAQEATNSIGTFFKGTFVAVLLVTVVQMIILPILDYQYVNRVCTAKCMGKFVDYDIRTIRKRVSRYSYRTITVYHPRYLIYYNGRKQLRTLPAYRKEPRYDVEAVLCFNPDGGEMYNIDEYKGNREVLFKIIAGVAIIVVFLIITTPLFQLTIVP